MLAIISSQPKNAMQSAPCSAEKWALTYADTGARFRDPVTRWVGSRSMTENQVTLSFDTKEDAISYAEKREIEYVVMHNKKESVVTRRKKYLDQFKG